MPEESISEILDYPVNSEGALVTRRGDLTRMKPKLNAPPPGQIGSVDWTMSHIFGDREKAVEIIESLVAGQGENADEKWLRFVILYRKWELQHKKGDIPEPPTLNQVCHALNFDARDFLGELQVGMKNLFTKVGAIKATMAIPAIVQKVVDVAESDEGDTKDRELALRLAGMIEDKNGLNVQINNQQNNIMLKSDKEKMKSPLLQFSDTVIDIDNEVRKEHE